MVLTIPKAAMFESVYCRHFITIVNGTVKTVPYTIHY